MNKRRWIGGVIALLLAALGVGYVAWIRSVWIDEGNSGIGRAAALATIVQAPLVIISVGVAAWQVVQSARATRQQAEDGAALEREQSRPYVAVSLDMDREWPSVYLDVTNFGRTAARDVQVKIEPDFVTSLTDMSAASRPHDARFLNDPIGTLVPGQRLTTLADMGPTRHEVIGRGVELASKFVARVTYTDAEANGRSRQTFSDEFVLDFDLLVDSTRISRHTVHDLVDRVEKLTKAVRER